ncbi:uncharacterized protein LOC131598755 [Vicia villosa]|uniref:uncharacterized protein LOC131598755 n=1 Tax=Vicia villosa TaxID=3911 RepID=UPI00273C50FE|nr:uncharacterized protein LOC131598755 [Vicia villosa]
MDKWRSIPFSKKEEEGMVVAEEEVCEEESFQRTLAGKLWTENSFNAEAFKSTMVSVWKLKNQVETQDLGKNLFLFKFATKRDLEFVLRSGPWSFDRSLLVLNRISGEEQSAELNMHFASFWVRIYELPLNLRSESMARKIGSVLGEFEEMDTREVCRNGRLPTFCFVCGRLGHQMKDCESLEDLSEEGFEEIEEQDLNYGQWLRASPLPKVSEDQKKRDSSSSICSKSLFHVSSGDSRCDPNRKGKGEEPEVQNRQEAKEDRGEVEGEHSNQQRTKQKVFEIEKVAESLGAVALSTEHEEQDKQPKGPTDKKGSGLGKKFQIKG